MRGLGGQLVGRGKVEGPCAGCAYGGVMGSGPSPRKGLLWVISRLRCPCRLAPVSARRPARASRASGAPVTVMSRDGLRGAASSKKLTFEESTRVKGVTMCLHRFSC